MPDGTLDTAFGTGGVILEEVNGIYDSINSVKIQPDGKIVVGGMMTRDGPQPTSKFFIIRYNANGTRDASFLGGGMALTAVN